jgi:hypothetical protein
MPASKQKFRSPRRYMPGTKLPDVATAAVEDRLFELQRESEWGRHIRFYRTDDLTEGTGGRGIRLDKLDKDDFAAHTLDFQVEGITRWALGMDIDTGENGASDFVLAYDPSANSGAGADVFRLSREADSGSADTAKVVLGRVVGTPRDQGEFFLIDGGDDTTPMGSVTAKGYFDGTTNALSFINRHSGNKACRFNWNNLWIAGTDITGANNSHLWLAFDSTSNKTRLFVAQNSDLNAKVGFGTISPQAIVSARTDATATSYNVVQRGFHMQYADSPGNRAVNIEQILSATEVWNYVWLNGTLGAGSTAATRVATSSFARAWGLESGDTSFAVITAPNGTNQTVSSLMKFDHSGGNNRIGVFGVTPQARPTAYTQTYSTADRTMANLTAAALTHSVGTADGTVDDVGAAFNQTTLNNNFKELTAQVANLLADITDVKQGLNAVIDDLQGYGWAQ